MIQGEKKITSWKYTEV